MKSMRLMASVVVAAGVLAVVAGLAMARTSAGSPAGTAFTYQGRLDKDGRPLDGTCNLRFRLWDSLDSGQQAGPTLTRAAVAIRRGIFTVPDLDFGNQFTGDARWLEVSVQCGSDPTYTALSPRQALTAAPLSSSLVLPFSAEGAADASLVSVTNSGTGRALQVESSGDDGLLVLSAGGDGVDVYSSGDDGFAVSSAGAYGLYIGVSAYDGVRVESAGGDGVYLGTAIGDGVYVGSTGDDGMFVQAAGGDGVFVQSALADGVRVSTASGDGLEVGSAGNHGVQILSAAHDGVLVQAAGDDGVYAHTTQVSNEWGFYTPDKIFAGSALASGGPTLIVAQNGDATPMEPGTVVVVSGIGAPFQASEFPSPLVRRAGAGGGAVAGVVYRRFAAEEETEETEQEQQASSPGTSGGMGKRTRLHSRSTGGPVAPGEYLLLVLVGPAQVRATAENGHIAAGDLLIVDSGGAASKIGASYSPGSLLGTAMEPLAVADGTGLIWVLVSPR